ncbi:response regulator transcription factor [Synechococcus sp. BA-132 BA5]|uniref:response regulator transcription factor n=1 Tax=Synechococcus sp. BA-132 BA5 TaxID=3110252 RepID=UPI002B1F879A|nr:response regulator transcription factor [Synechococcus sp. BA-132 BA5]MEA5417290.1 response regulator transcription factor [Synechococcus sp. BA-132 BA5]
MPLRILLVEDEGDLASAIQTVLQRQGHVVDHCGDGLTGWTLLIGEPAEVDGPRYDLAILDWMLPDLSKPFAMEELLARVRALQRRQPSYREPVLEVGPYRFDPQSGQLQVRTSDGVVTVPLAGKEEQLMAYFLEHRDRGRPFCAPLAARGSRLSQRT